MQRSMSLSRFREGGRDARLAVTIATTRSAVRARREDVMACFAPLAAAFRRVALAGALVLSAAGAGAEETTLLRVNAFPNAKALPLHAGIAAGIFAKRGLNIELHLTEN